MTRKFESKTGEKVWIKASNILLQWIVFCEIVRESENCGFYCVSGSLIFVKEWKNLNKKNVRLQCLNTVHVKFVPTFNWCHVESSPDHAKVPQWIGSLHFNPSNWKIIVDRGLSNHQIVMKGKKGMIAFYY